MGIPSIWKVFIGLDDSYTLRLMTLCFLISTSTGSNIKTVFFTSSFAMLIIYLREINKLSNLSITNTFAKDVPNSLEIIAYRSSSKAFLFLVRCNFFIFVFNCRKLSFLRWCWLIMLHMSLCFGLTLKWYLISSSISRSVLTGRKRFMPLLKRIVVVCDKIMDYIYKTKILTKRPGRIFWINQSVF